LNLSKINEDKIKIEEDLKLKEEEMFKMKEDLIREKSSSDVLKEKI
jgi:hypothetical protein